ncbi:MAG: winged helix-turn-helix domain-containing protein [Chloroflexota bacterium]
MSIPTFDKLLLPLLELAADDLEHSFSEAVDSLALKFGVTGPELAELLPSARYPRFRHRVGWAKSDLVKSGLLERVGRARFRITERGHTVLTSPPAILDRRFLGQFPEFRAYQRRVDDTSTSSTTSRSPGASPPSAIPRDEGSESSSQSILLSDAPPPLGGLDASAEPDFPTEPDFGHSEAQWYLAKIGAALRLKVWIPKNDRQKNVNGEKLADISIPTLPAMGFPPQALGIVQNIDVLWLENDLVVCAFEVEHSTVVYSGLLRLSDLLTVLPYTPIQLYVVAGQERRPRIRRELTRPTFAKLDLHRRCKYIAYDSLKEQFQVAIQHGGYLNWRWIEGLAEFIVSPPAGEQTP